MDRPKTDRPAFALFRAALRRVLMPSCIVCGLDVTGAHGEPVCPACLDDFFPADCVRCRICAIRLPAGRAVSPDLACGRCLARPPQFDASVALADYAAPVDGMIAALKFHARLDLGWAFGWLLAQRMQNLDFDAVVPVPLSPQRLRERGYNQAEEIARAISVQLRRPLLRDALVRQRHRPAQQELGLAQRRTNVRGAFAVGRPPAVRRLLLVDDVLTTGSTLDDAATCLRRAGARVIINAVAARTP